MDALPIVEKWIDYAHRAGKRDALAALWTVRDILEGIFHTTYERGVEATRFVLSCKPSAERDAIISALQFRGDYTREAAIDNRTKEVERPGDVIHADKQPDRGSPAQAQGTYQPGELWTDIGGDAVRGLRL